MKYLVLFAVLAIAYFLWRNARRDARKSSAPRGGKPPAPVQDMVRCAHCGVHLPRDDALGGRSGRHFCSPEHQRLGGG